MFVSLAVCSVAKTTRQSDDMGKVKKERQIALKKVDETTSKLKTNKQKTARSLRELNTISADIHERQHSIRKIEAEVAKFDGQIQRLNDSITETAQRLERLRRDYAEAVRKMNVHSSSFDQMMFIFSSSTVHEAYRRMKYLRQFSKWRTRQAAEIEAEVKQLERQKIDVLKLKDARIRQMSEINQSKRTLESKKARQSQLITELKKEGGELQKLLDQQNKKAESLDRKLEQLIAEQERKEAERRRAEEARKAKEREQSAKRASTDKSKSSEQKATTTGKKKATEAAPEPIVVTTEKKQSSTASQGGRLTGTFESNKGRLPWPIDRDCRVISRFGKQQHPELKHVMTNNSGIDIEAARGANARTVFDGKVSAVFRQDGYNMVVMVRHGSYLTIYVNLSEIYVRVGQTVKMYQSIGKISPDLDHGGRAVLHFEVRHEREKLNPTEWLK